MLYATMKQHEALRAPDSADNNSFMTSYSDDGNGRDIQSDLTGRVLGSPRSSVWYRMGTGYSDMGVAPTTTPFGAGVDHGKFRTAIALPRVESTAVPTRSAPIS